jgi:hypothetical protein
MKKRNIVILTLLALAGVAGSQAASFTYSAAVANNLLGFNGQALTINDTVEIGTYLNGTFTSLHAGTPVDANGPGFFQYAQQAFQNTNSIAGQQLAIQWSEAASGQSAILYVDITTTGLDAIIKDQWTVKAGDGTGLDTIQNIIDISDLTTGGNFNTLRDGATFVNAHFTAALNVAGAPSFQIGAVPEPSTYAAFAGLIALLAVMVKRRRG